MLNLKEELKQKIKDIYEVGNLILSSGDGNEHYINLKFISLTSEGASTIGKILSSYINFDETIAGLLVGAAPLVTATSLQSRVDGLLVRKNYKKYGAKNQVEGLFPKDGSKIVILDDVTTTGQSILYCANVLRQFGFKIERAITIVDREEGATNLLKENGIELESVFKLEEIIND